MPPETWLVSQKPDSGFSDDEDEETEVDNLSIYGPKAIVYKGDEDDVDDDDSDIEIEGKPSIKQLQQSFQR